MSLQDAVDLAISYSRPCEECAAWRAQVEALAGALRELRVRYCVVTGGDLHGGYCLLHEDLPTSHDPYCEGAALVLARLPAQALAERRALEACAERLRVLHANVPAVRALPEVWGDLAGLDASRRDAEE